MRRQESKCVIEEICVKDVGGGAECPIAATQARTRGFLPKPPARREAKVDAASRLVKLVRRAETPRGFVRDDWLVSFVFTKIVKVGTGGGGTFPPARLGRTPMRADKNVRPPAINRRGCAAFLRLRCLTLIDRRANHSLSDAESTAL